MSGKPENDIKGDFRYAAREVAEAEALCQRQVGLIEHLRAHREHIADAEELLAKLQDTLAVMRRLQQHLSAGARQQS